MNQSAPAFAGTPCFDDLRAAAARLESEIAAGPIVPQVSPEEIRRHLAARYNFAGPLPLDSVIADVEHLLRRYQVHVTHPRYFGLFNPSVTVASVVADSLVAMYNPQLATWRTSPAANEIERHVLAWLAGKFGLPLETISNFTSGGSEANFSALIAALTRAFPPYRDSGLRALASSPVIYLTHGAHHGFLKIARMSGLGSQALHLVSMTSDLKMDIDDLARKVAADRQSGFTPLLVVATAGTTTAGVIDPLPELAGFCRSQDLWFHVDAAWGGAAALSPRLRHHLDGISQADSVTCDAHKWFSVPMGAGMFFCRHPDSVTQAFESEISFMPSTHAAVLDPYSYTVQWSRRFIGLKLFMTLAERGESGYSEMIDHQTRMGDLLRQSLQSTGWPILNKTPLPLLCFTRDGLNVTRFLRELLDRQIAWMSEVRLLDDQPAIRACITSFRTTGRDIEAVVAGMNRIA